MSIEQNIISLAETYFSGKVNTIAPLPESGSYRKYYRITSQNQSILGAYNPDKKENIAFIEFSKHFIKHKLNVPKIYTADLKKNIYLLEDLGDNTLFSYITNNRDGDFFTNEIIDYYKKSLTQLPKFQISAGKSLDFSLCYPRHSFDAQSMNWDLNYFKYYFLKLAKIQFDEQKLEDDFTAFIGYLLKTDCSYFMYRDFQSRNIMLKDEEVYFIDYQGGRKGALQYDVASLLYDAKANMPNDVRVELLNYYINNINGIIKVDNQDFIEHYYGYVLIRIMQALGAYGFRGFYENKAHFLQSIPYAIENIKWLLQNTEIPVKIPVIKDVLQQITESEFLMKFKPSVQKLSVNINSFSYKSTQPTDTSGNGGGFVFDCRALPNPGRYDAYKKLTGKDKEVIQYLESEPETGYFFANVCRIVDQSVDNYLKRGFSNLMVNFGCTGGQHRSVFFAEKLAKYLSKKHEIEILLKHTSLNNI